MNWFASQCRKVMYNMAFGTQFRYFGKACTLEINGQVKIGKNVYIGDHVSLIVEQGAILEIADHSFIGESCYIKCFGGKVLIGKMSALIPNRLSMAVVVSRLAITPVLVRKVF
jgi:acetyltransferase-like isoleucine patch superfamily enzyme